MPNRRRYRIGTRGSVLATRQAEYVREQMTALHPEVTWDVVRMKALADQQPSAPLQAMAGEGIFVKELEQALLDKAIDIAVHSLKDMPLRGVSAELILIAIPPRQDPHDALVTRAGDKLRGLPPGARIGTSSLRRQSQLLHLRPDLTVVPVRGNVDTRLRKMQTEPLDGIVVAAAGLIRLGFASRITELLHQLVPEPGQGALAVQIRAADAALRAVTQQLDDPLTRVAVETERRVLGALGGGCHVPIGALAMVEETRLHLHALVASPDGKQLVQHKLSGALRDSARIAEESADYLKANGAAAILEKLPVS